ncbi:RecB-like helicase [uncultured Helicobacter sp.]|uniref:RecB-like helicase n=1 Tax=uncultured Helicobacter sp. TaxID=175537 RepID=UPI00262F51E6|nr:RecB-like helicase [uncultured Helicobacter sp.]
MQYPLLCLSASAGSGKTYQLTMRYLNLLLLGAKPSSILTLTFTRKAAQEMEERIIKNIKELYDNKNNREYINKFEFIAIKDEQDWQKWQDKIYQIYREFLCEDLKITTIDAFLQKILKNFCWYAGVEQNFGLQEDDLVSITEIFLSRLERIDFEQIVEICYEKKQTLNHLLNLCVFLDSFKEMLTPSLFVPQIMQKEKRQGFDTRIQAMEYANRLKDAYYNEKGEIPSSLDFEDFANLLEKGKTWLMKENIEDYRGFKKIPFNPGDFERLKKTIYRVLLEEEAEYLEKLYQIFQSFLEAKEEYYQQNNCLSFNAVASKVYALLTKNILDKDFLYFRLDSALNHILIDEFQDTSILQYEILKPLIQEIKGGKGAKNFERSFFYVGDIKQSIYRFRGGNPELFKIASQGMECQVLEANYRSSRHIVEFVNDIFKGAIQDFIPQIPKVEMDGYVQVQKFTKDSLYLEVFKGLESLKSLGAKEEGIAILVFDNKSVVELAQILQEKGIRVVMDTSAKLINHNEVRALIEILKYIQTKNIQFKQEFFMLLGLEITESQNKNLEKFLDSIIKIKEPAKILLKIMEYYHIASLSAKKFLESCLQFYEINELLEQVERLALDIVSSDFSGIRIMTIHKSKGLEFENVLVVDKINGSSHQRENIFFEFKESGIEIERIFKHSNKIRNHLDNAYQNALCKEEALEMQDLKNQVYVALTRAKNTMNIFCLDEKSAFGFLQLEEQERGELKNAIQMQKHQKKQNLESLMPFYRVTLTKPILENLGRQKEMYIGENELENSRKEEGFSNLKAIYRGIALHFVMEQKLKNLLSNELILELLDNKMGFYLTRIELEKIITQCNFVIKNQKLIEILAKGKVKCEIPYLSCGRQKRLDLLVIGDKEAFVVDYKSGAPKESHLIQVREYIESVRFMLQKETYGYIFYTQGEGRLVEV